MEDLELIINGEHDMLRNLLDANYRGFTEESGDMCKREVREYIVNNDSVLGESSGFIKNLSIKSLRSTYL